MPSHSTPRTGHSASVFLINSRAIACGATAYKMKHLPFDFKRARARNAIGSA
jgi:hypothetical protein